jgi:hypothetical protein
VSPLLDCVCACPDVAGAGEPGRIFESRHSVPPAGQSPAPAAGSAFIPDELNAGPLVATLGPRRAHSSSGLGHRPLTAAARVRIPYAPLCVTWLAGFGSTMCMATGRGRAHVRPTALVAHPATSSTTSTGGWSSSSSRTPTTNVCRLGPNGRASVSQSGPVRCRCYPQRFFPRFPKKGSCVSSPWPQSPQRPTAVFARWRRCANTFVGRSVEPRSSRNFPVIAA